MTMPRKKAENRGKQKKLKTYTQSGLLKYYEHENYSAYHLFITCLANGNQPINDQPPTRLGVLFLPSLL